MFQKVYEWYLAIPRDREWWLDRFAEVSTGCFSGCMTIIVCYVVSIVTSFAVAALFARNLTENFTMALAWGSTLGLLVTLVLGSAVLSIIAWLRGA